MIGKDLTILGHEAEASARDVIGYPIAQGRTSSNHETAVARNRSPHVRVGSKCETLLFRR